MAGRPKDPTIDKKIFSEIERLLEMSHYGEITIEQIAENTGVSKETIYRRWKDKASIIIDMFVTHTRDITFNHINLYDALFAFATQIMAIYKTNLGRAVIEILVSSKQSEARGLFMKGYFESNRRNFKEMIAPYLNEEDQDLMIDLVFSPIYFNILIKPQELDEHYIQRLLKRLLKAYDIEQ